MKRTCTQCNISKDSSEFYVRKRPNSVDGLFGYCKQCATNKAKKIQYDFKRKCLEYKETLECIACGYDKHQAVLDFHHLDPTQKEFNLSKIKGNSELSLEIKQELDKCIVLCSNCHREIHLNLIEYKDNKIIKKEISLENFEWEYLTDKPKEIKTPKTRVTKITWPSVEVMSKLIFEKPIIQLAQELNVSDSAIIKFCKKHNINRPKKGFWLTK